MLSIVRYQTNDSMNWGVANSNVIFKLDIECTSTKDLLQLGLEKLKKEASKALDNKCVKYDKLLSPITKDAKVLCQGANYKQHMIDSGMNPDDKKFNMFFTKSGASIHSPEGSIIKPKHVTLLDYEIELSLVLGVQTEGPVSASNKSLSNFIAGICIGNDISARDVQIPQMQFHKGKSYRTFCPLGPYLVLLDPEEFHHLDNLQLELSVNGETRQSDNTRNLVFKPAETITEFSQIVDFEPGDIIMTGTPSGCALGLPSPFVIKLSGLLPEKKKWSLFQKVQNKRPHYLKHGDRIQASIKSPCGTLDLGTQIHTVSQES